MRVMVMAILKPEAEGAPPPPMEAFEAMQKYNEELAKAGILLAAEGLAPTSKSKRVKFSGEKRTVIDGPFSETKELVGGFTILKVSSMEEAIEIVKRAPFYAGAGDAEVEIRKLMDMEDFAEMAGDDFKPSEEVAKVKFKDTQA